MAASLGRKGSKRLLRGQIVAARRKQMCETNPDTTAIKLQSDKAFTLHAAQNEGCTLGGGGIGDRGMEKSYDLIIRLDVPEQALSFHGSSVSANRCWIPGLLIALRRHEFCELFEALAALWELTTKIRAQDFN